MVRTDYAFLFQIEEPRIVRRPDSEDWIAEKAKADIFILFIPIVNRRIVFAFPEVVILAKAALVFILELSFGFFNRDFRLEVIGRGFF